MRVVVIYNPSAGKATRKRRDFEVAMDLLRAGGWSLDMKPTNAAGHATEIARDAVLSGADAVIAAGGDGTVNETIQALAHSPVSLGVLPMGTVNVWAKEAGFSSNVIEAAKQLTSGHRVQLDMGKAGDRYFLLMAGVGFDAEVTATLGVGKNHKQQLGVLPYLVRTMQVLPRYRGASVEIDLDGRLEHHDVLMVLASNTRLYGGFGKPAPNAVANDGMLDVRLFHGTGPAHSVGHITRMLLASRGNPDNIDVIRAEKIRVTATPKLAVQVDGDPAGTTPIEISIQQDALWALVAPSHDRTLFRPKHA